MSKLVWNPAWTTGVSFIDEQHHELFSQFECILVAIHDHKEAQRLSELLFFLADYVETHFSAEEAQMKMTGYPGFARHKAIHDGMRTRVNELVREFESNAEGCTSDVIDFLTNWLVEHIGVEDMPMARHLLGHEGTRPGNQQA